MKTYSHPTVKKVISSKNIKIQRFQSTFFYDNECCIFDIRYEQLQKELISHFTPLTLSIDFFSSFALVYKTKQI